MPSGNSTVKEIMLVFVSKSAFLIYPIISPLTHMLLHKIWKYQSIKNKNWLIHQPEWTSAPNPVPIWCYLGSIFYSGKFKILTYCNATLHFKWNIWYLSNKTYYICMLWSRILKDSIVFINFKYNILLLNTNFYSWGKWKPRPK